MAKSKYVVTFVGIPDLDDVLNITDSLSANPLLEIFVDTRQGGGQTEIDEILNLTVQAANYVTAIGLDYNSTSLYTITQNANEVTVEAVLDNVVFAVQTNTNPTDIDVVITNEVVAPSFTIDTITFSQADADVCNTVKVNVTTSELAIKVTSPLLIDPNTDNPFDFDWIRGVTISIDCETATESDSESIELPAILSVATTTLTLFNTPTGANLTVTHDDTYLLDLEYSLNDADWQDSNVFNGLSEGNYIVYIRDQFGCKIQKDFAVSIFSPDISVTVSEFVLSKSMSIRYKRDIVWGNCSDYKNEENTLSCEYNAQILYQTRQLFQTCDLITTQFKSNYETLAANVINSDGSKDALSVVKKSNNLDKKDKRDATFYDINGTQTGIYFTSGNTYDYATGLPIGTYALNGLLPEWGVIGNFIFLDGIGWFTIVDKTTYSDSSVTADVLVIDYAYTGIPATIIVSSNYNLFNFEVYEFNIDMSVYENLEFQVEILNTDDVFTNIRMLSELIEVAERHANTLEIEYWNPSNTDVFYITGIKNKIRICYETFYPNIDPDIEGLDTDSVSILLDSSMYEINILTISRVAVGIMRQLSQAFLHKELYLDGVKYRISDDPEVENHGSTNYQTIVATFKKSENVYNSEFDGIAPGISSEIEIIGLLTDDNDYIKV